MSTIDFETDLPPRGQTALEKTTEEMEAHIATQVARLQAQLKDAVREEVEEEHSAARGLDKLEIERLQAQLERVKGQRDEKDKLLIRREAERDRYQHDLTAASKENFMLKSMRSTFWMAVIVALAVGFFVGCAFTFRVRIP